MKNIQKLVIIFISISFLNGMKIDINKNYITELLNYKVELPKYIDNPFVVKQIKIIKKNKKSKRVKKRIYVPKFVEKKIYLLAVLNKKVLVKVEGLNVKKWLKEGDVIEGYKIRKIINNNSILVSIKNKTKIITMKQKNNINIKVVQ